MTDRTWPAGMVDDLSGLGGGPTEDLQAFARAYMVEGEMDAEIVARIRAPERIAERERIVAESRARDWPNLGYYRDDNAALAGRTTDIVFIGDSITEMWRIAQPDLFRNGVVNRGISGQTSPQILLRFMADVVALRPRAVHILCGCNDVAGNTGPTTPQDYQANIRAMVELARAHGITVILAGLTPINGLAWAPQVVEPQRRAAELNVWLKAFAAERGLIHADYASVLTDGGDGMDARFHRDGVHPGALGYAAMRPVAEAAMAEALDPQRT